MKGIFWNGMRDELFIFLRHKISQTLKVWKTTYAFVSAHEEQE